MSVHQSAIFKELHSQNQQLLRSFVAFPKENDTHTLGYDWFLSGDGTECEVREAYTGPKGLIEDNRNILEARTKLFREYADGHFMTFYGESSQALLELLKVHSVGFKWFSSLKDPESSACNLLLVFRWPAINLLPRRGGIRAQVGDDDPAALPGAEPHSDILPLS